MLRTPGDGRGLLLMASMCAGNAATRQALARAGMTLRPTVLAIPGEGESGSVARWPQVQARL